MENLAYITTKLDQDARSIRILRYCRLQMGVKRAAKSEKKFATGLGRQPSAFWRGDLDGCFPWTLCSAHVRYVFRYREALPDIAVSDKMSIFDETLI